MDVPKTFSNGRFERVSELVKRQNCIVYKGKDQELGGREIAIKVFVDRPNDNEEFIESFEKEVEAFRGVAHEVFVPIIAGGCEDGWFYIAMELIEGKSLRDFLKDRKKPMKISQATEIVSDIGLGLRELHESGSFHGHLDTRSILFKGDSVRVAGYYPQTIGRILREMTSGGRLIIDPHYIAPEQISNSSGADFRSDIYSLSAILFELVSGEKPFSGGSPLEIAMKRMAETPKAPARINSDVTPLLDAAILKGLSRDPDERFTTIEEMVDAVTGGKGVTKNPFADMAAEDAERLGSETIGVSMSKEALQQILQSHASTTSEPSSSKTSSATSNNADQLDVAATVMGASTAQLIKGSLVYLDGPNRGEKITLEKPLTIIGSDSSCDVVVTGKGVPPRYAIIVLREGEYYVGPLSPEGIVVNEETRAGSDEVPMQRGDIISVGSLKVRYVAPGEVFTLRDEVADRVVDRPESKVQKYAWIGAVLLLIVGSAGVYMYSESVESEKSRRAKEEQHKEKKRKEIITKLVREGDEFFKKGDLVDPIGANAQERFSKVLEFNPDDLYAKRRLAEIKDRVKDIEGHRRRKEQLRQRIAALMTDAGQYLKNGNLVSPPGSNARDTYEEVLRMDPQNDVAKAKIKEIERLLGDVVGRTEGLMARARVYIDLGQYTEPKKENALDLVRSVLKVDPRNLEATNAIYHMAADSIVAGDQAKASAKPHLMKKAFLTAQALGVDPEYLSPRMEGAKLMEKTRSSVIIFDRNNSQGKNKKKDKDGKKDQYLDSDQVEKRVAELSLSREYHSSRGRVFIDMGKH